MTQKNTTAIERGAMLAKQQMNQAKAGKPPTLAAMLSGNRAQRWAVQKKMKKVLAYPVTICSNESSTTHRRAR